MRKTATALVCATIMIGACDEDRQDVVQVPGKGALEVTINGLPGGRAADALVTGPSSFSRAVTATTTIANLDPGTYTVTAHIVSTPGVSYAPAPASQSVTVKANDTAGATIAYASTSFALGVQSVVQGLASPVYLTAPPNDARLFIVEQAGRIRIFKNGALLSTPFLDVAARVQSGGERGLLSMAFDPAYTTNGRFYIYYTDGNGDIVVDRHTVSANADVANTSFDNVIIVAHRQAGNHNGGLVMFGPDGMLYIGTGDGGGGGDPQNNGQNTNSLLGKLLRLNVASLPYTIPSGNPFANGVGADEIWAYGLRNPWRFAFDGITGSATLYIADVGQNAWEEINAMNAAVAGLNYGWRTMEGTHCYNPANGCNTTGLTQPVHEYNHSDGCSVTGGFVYRGSSIPEIRGHYFYSDYCSGWLRSFRISDTAATDHFSWPIGDIGNITSFGVDGFGELFMLSDNGRAYKVIRQ